MSDSSNYLNMSDLDDIEDIELVMQLKQGESSRRSRKGINRDRDVAEARLLADYFGPSPKYPDYYFRRRYRMNRSLFLEIVQGIEKYIKTHYPLPAHFDFFVVRPDATGLMGFSVIIKCTSVIRQLAYNTSPDALDEYLQMGEHCARDCLDCFNMCIIDLFTPEFLRKPDVNDVRKLYDAHNRIHGLPGVIKKYPTIMLEAVASYDLWIWHAFFGVAGANNDLTVLNHSPLFDDLLDDIAPVVPFEVNGVTFEKGYYLADGIYPQWAAFVKSFTVARDERNAVFKRRQESARKDVERAFGVLQGRWHIIAQPARAWTVNKLRRIMYTCIILHNMILKNQKFALSDIGDTYICPRANLARTWIERCEAQRKQAKELRDKQTHAKLQRNLIEHVWQQHLLND
ncbi:ALP1-like protein isoform X1 [Tanacetum coccineum]